MTTKQKVRFTRRPASEDDKEFCFSAARRSYEPVVSLQFGEWDDLWQRQEFEKRWDPKKLEIIEIDGVGSGVLWMEWRKDHYYIAEIQLLPECQNLGIGTAIIEDTQARARSKNCPVRLQVLKMNRARKLYERLGFKLCGQTSTHFQMLWESAESALL